MDYEKYTSCTIFLKESIQGFKEIDFSRIKTDHVATILGTGHKLQSPGAGTDFSKSSNIS